MGDTLHSSAPALRYPRRFAAEAWDDLRVSPRIAWRLFVATFRARRRRALLGYFWLLLPTLGTAAVCAYLQFHRIIDIGSTRLPYAIHVLAGLTLWQAFVDALNAPVTQLAAARQMITRSRVPHEALILAGVLDLLVNVAVRLAVLALAISAFAIVPAPSAAMIPLGVAALVVTGLAVGLAAAPFALLFEDVNRALMLLTTLWFFLTPILYPAPVNGLLALNPVSPLLDTTRAWILEPAWTWDFAAVAAAASAALVLAWLLYRIARPHVMARLG